VEANPDEAEIVETVVAATGLVVIENVAEVAPAGTKTLGGGAADKLLLWKLTTLPPDGAGWERVTVPVAPAPPATVAGVTVTLLTGSVP
jgi:hypothetical protein